MTEPTEADLTRAIEAAKMRYLSAVHQQHLRLAYVAANEVGGTPERVYTTWCEMIDEDPADPDQRIAYVETLRDLSESAWEVAVETMREQRA